MYICPMTQYFLNNFKQSSVMYKKNTTKKSVIISYNVLVNYMY